MKFSGVWLDLVGFSGYQVPGTRYRVPGTWQQVPGTRYLELILKLRPGDLPHKDFVGPERFFYDRSTYTGTHRDMVSKRELLWVCVCRIVMVFYKQMHVCIPNFTQSR